MVHFLFHENPLVYVPPIKAAMMRHGSTWISSIGTTGGSKRDVCEQHMFLKDRPGDCSYGNPKRRISGSRERPLALVLNV